MDYSVAKLINCVGIVAGWLLLGIGVISFFVVAQSDVLTAVFSAAVLAASGLVLVAICQMANATIHTAEESKDTNELLKELIGKGASSSITQHSMPPSAPEASSIKHGETTGKDRSVRYLLADGERAEHETYYKGFFITKTTKTGTYIVEGYGFESLPDAKEYIDKIAI